jgi:hypothetical protein
MKVYIIVEFKRFNDDGTYTTKNFKVYFNEELAEQNKPKSRNDSDANVCYFIEEHEVN